MIPSGGRRIVVAMGCIHRLGPCLRGPRRTISGPTSQAGDYRLSTLPERPPVSFQEHAMSVTDYVIDLLLILIIFRQVRFHQLTFRAVLFPLARWSSPGPPRLGSSWVRSATRPPLHGRSTRPGSARKSAAKR
jgi:hypothetical protein